uniref:Uncharacterized protein n=1 Tax=Peronospora matthiolae TaxID=2874970 RepID=A0AAV1U0R2_9STRA
MRYLSSSITENPVDEHTLINVFIYGLVDGPVKTYVFREGFHALEKAIEFAGQEDFSLTPIQAIRQTIVRRDDRKQKIPT